MSKAKRPIRRTAKTAMMGPAITPALIEDEFEVDEVLWSVAIAAAADEDVALVEVEGRELVDGIGEVAAELTAVDKVGVVVLVARPAGIDVACACDDCKTIGTPETRASEGTVTTWVTVEASWP